MPVLLFVIRTSQTFIVLEKAKEMLVPFTSLARQSKQYEKKRTMRERRGNKILRQSSLLDVLDSKNSFFSTCFSCPKRQVYSTGGSSNRKRNNQGRTTSPLHPQFRLTALVPCTEDKTACDYFQPVRTRSITHSLVMECGLYRSRTCSCLNLTRHSS